MQQISNNLPPKKQFRKDGYFRSKQHPRQFINRSSAFNLGSSSKCNQRNCVSIMSAEKFHALLFSDDLCGEEQQQDNVTIFGRIDYLTHST